MERSNDQFLSSILGLTLGLPAFVVPSVTQFSRQSDPEPAHPDENNGQGAIPGPKLCQASFLLCSSGPRPLSPLHPHSQGL